MRFFCHGKGSVSHCAFPEHDQLWLFLSSLVMGTPDLGDEIDKSRELFSPKSPDLSRLMTRLSQKRHPILKRSLS